MRVNLSKNQLFPVKRQIIGMGDVLAMRNSAKFTRMQYVLYIRAYFRAHVGRRDGHTDELFSSA